MATKTVVGLEGVRKALEETPKQARAVIREAVRDTVRITAQRTRQNAPYDTGALRAAISEKPPTRSGLNGFVTVEPGTFNGRVPSAYVLALEYGKGPGARPFIRSTSEAEGGRFVARVTAAGKELERDLENFGGRNL